MTREDIQFLKAVGIDPCSLGDPLPGSLPPPPPTEAPIPKLAEEDSRWLQDLRVAWEHEPEPDFMPPKTFREYLARYPQSWPPYMNRPARMIGTYTLAYPSRQLSTMPMPWSQALVRPFAYPGAQPHRQRPKYRLGFPENGILSAAPARKQVQFRYSLSVLGVL